MSNPSKYSKIERERKFLLAACADCKNLPSKTISDLYIKGTNLRLRKVSGQFCIVYKLTKKIRLEAAGCCEITTIYLEQAEYELLAKQPGVAIEKTRYLKVTGELTMGIDNYISQTGQLWLAEIEFENDEHMQSFVMPMNFIKEVTNDAEFNGYELALKFK